MIIEVIETVHIAKRVAVAGRLLSEQLVTVEQSRGKRVVSRQMLPAPGLGGDNSVGAITQDLLDAAGESVRLPIAADELEEGEASQAVRLDNVLREEPEEPALAMLDEGPAGPVVASEGPDGPAVATEGPAGPAELNEASVRAALEGVAREKAAAKVDIYP